MSVSMASSSEQKYITLRKRLDQFGYKQPLAVESLPLVEKLFQDLIHTTEALKKSKDNPQSSSSADKSADLPLLAQPVHPYKNDNVRLIKENNDLHLELLKCREQFDTNLKEFKNQLRKLENENADLRFLNTSYINRLRSLEKESRQKDNKILELQEKNFQAVVQTPGGNKHTIPFRRQRLDIDEMLPENPSSLKNNIYQLPYIDDPYIIDMVKVAEDRVAELEIDVQNQKEIKEALETKLTNYKYQVENRDREIERLGRLLDGGRSADVLALESKLKSNEKLIAHQNVQIDYLHEKNRQLERRLQELIDLKRDLSSKQFEERLKNDDLLRDLKDIDRLARKVHADKEYTVEIADRELNEAKLEIKQNHHELESLDAKIANLNLERKNLLEELETLKVQASERDNEIIRLQDFIERVQTDKTRLSKRLSKLVLNEKDLLQELQKSRRTTKPATSSGPTKKLSLPARFDVHLKNVEDERDLYKNEVDTLQKLLDGKFHHRHTSHSPTSRARSSSPQLVTRSSPQHRLTRKDTATSPIKRSLSASTSPVRSPTRCTVCGVSRNRVSSVKDSSHYENLLRNVEDERDRFKRELNKYKNSSRSSREKDVDDTQLARVLREKDDLQLLLNKFERHMAEIQGHIKVLTNERDSLSVLYDRTKEELQNARHDLLQNAQTPKVSLAAQSILRKVENERDNAIVELRAVTNERDSLKERLRISTDTALNERARYEQRIENLEIEIRKIDNDREESIQQSRVLHEQIDQLENKLREQSFNISQLNQELSDQKSTSTQLRFLSEEAERLVQEHQRQLSLKKEEIRSAEDKALRLEKKLYDLQEANKGIKDDFNVVRTTVNTLDKEKDRLCSELDIKTEENIHLIQELNSKTRRIDELNMMTAELEAALDRSKDDSKQKLKEISSMRMQLDRNLEDTNDLHRKLDSSMRDMKRLQDDLLTVTRENQTIHQELEHAIDDKENLKLQVQDYINEVSKCEDLITQKEHDRNSLVEQYREASGQLNQMKMTIAELEAETSNRKQELNMKTSDLKRLNERIEYLERELQQQLSIGQEYEIQLSNLNRSLQRNEDIIKKLQNEKQGYADEIGNIKDFNSTLEMKKEQMTRHLTGKEIENEQLQSAVSDMKIEIEMLRNQIQNEKAMVRSLEDLIGSTRDKEFQLQLQSQEKESELQLFKDRVNMNDMKVQNQNKEIASLRTQVISLETDNERLKRQLTSERFEREKAAQELRKMTDLTSHIDLESRFRNTSPKLTTTNGHRSPVRNYSPQRTETRSPTKGIERSCSLCGDTTP